MTPQTEPGTDPGMDPAHAILFQPVRIGPVTAPNRFYRHPMPPALAGSARRPGPRCAG